LPGGISSPTSVRKRKETNRHKGKSGPAGIGGKKKMAGCRKKG